jgi:hypothetical protein
MKLVIELDVPDDVIKTFEKDREFAGDNLKIACAKIVIAAISGRAAAIETTAFQQRRAAEMRDSIKSA